MFLPWAYNELIRFITLANSVRLVPVTPLKYFLGMPDALSFGTLLRFAIEL